ncbi:hypothetical protein Tco_0535627 [Tanacetum coccineum]
MANFGIFTDTTLIAYLKKPSRSEGFQEIVDFLNVDNREQEITTTVDGKEFTVTEASVRRHLQLADVDCSKCLPTTKIDQLSLYRWGTHSQKTLRTEEKEGEGSGHPSEPQPPPSTAQPTNEEPILNETVYKEWDDRVERATTTAASLDAEQARLVMALVWSRFLSEVLHRPMITFPESHTSSDFEGSMTLQVIGRFLCKLYQETGKLRGKMIEEIDQDAGVTLVTPTQGENQPEDQRRRAVSTGSGGISTTGASMHISTAGMVQEINISIPSPVVVKDKEEEWENIRARVEADEELSKEQHMGSHTLQQLKKYSFDELKELFETTMKNVNTFVSMETEDKRRASELATGSSQATIIDSAEVGSSKRAAEAELDHKDSKRQNTNEASRSIQ